MGLAADSAAAAGEEVTAAAVVLAAVVSAAEAAVSAAGMAAAAEVGDPGEDLAADLEAAVAAAVEDLAVAGGVEWDSAEADPTELIHVVYRSTKAFVNSFFKCVGRQTRVPFADKLNVAYVRFHTLFL